MSMVQQAIEVGAPLHTVYEQIATFENYPRFMTGVEEVTPLGGDRTHWVMDLDGHRREFDARITELSLDERISWSTTDGPLLSETITLRPMGETRTRYHVAVDVEDRAGVLAEIATAFAEEEVSIQTLRQEGRGADAQLVLVSHESTDAQLSRTVDRLRGLACVREVSSVMRVEGMTD